MVGKLTADISEVDLKPRVRRVRVANDRASGASKVQLA